MIHSKVKTVSEEGSVENRESVEEYREQQDQPQEPQEPPAWSAPGSLEPIPDAEPPSYEPLQPLEPSTMANAIAESITPETPDFDSYLEQFTQQRVSQKESVAPRVLRPVTRVSSDTCPSGFLGFCVTCSLMPCGYIVSRVLRDLLSKVR